LVGKSVQVDMEFAICKAQEEKLSATESVIHQVRSNSREPRGALCKMGHARCFVCGFAFVNST
jgi:hypothetical protein